MPEDNTPDVDDDTTTTQPPEGEQQDDAADKKPDEEEFDAHRARAKIAKANSEAANLRKRLKELEPLAAKAKELQDATKSETDKLIEDRDGHKSRADTAETALRKLTVALEAAPDGASLPHVRAVAKRLAGETDEELAEDAAELYELFGAKGKAKVAGRPKENLRGGTDPDEPVEETDPRKLADLIRRRT